MPPWKADASVGHWKNMVRMTQAEIDLLDEWVDDRAPEGDPADAPLP